jgi:tetratricopeptide (TPR) repeat protein
METDRLNIQAAFNDYNKAIALDPGFAEAYLERGILYISLGQKKKGCPDLQRAYTHGSSLAKKALQDLCK